MGKPAIYRVLCPNHDWLHGKRRRHISYIFVPGYWLKWVADGEDGCYKLVEAPGRCYQDYDVDDDDYETLLKNNPCIVHMPIIWRTCVHCQKHGIKVGGRTPFASDDEVGMSFLTHLKTPRQWCHQG